MKYKPDLFFLNLLKFIKIMKIQTFKVISLHNLRIVRNIYFPANSYNSFLFRYHKIKVVVTQINCARMLRASLSTYVLQMLLLIVQTNDNRKAISLKDVPVQSIILNFLSSLGSCIGLGIIVQQDSYWKFASFSTICEFCFV